MKSHPAVLRYPGNRTPHLELLLSELAMSYGARPQGEFEWNNNTSSWDLRLQMSPQTEQEVGLVRELKRFNQNFTCEASLVTVVDLAL